MGVSYSDAGTQHLKVANLHRFEFFAILNATANFFHNLTNGDSHRDLDQAAAIHFSGKGKNLGTFALFASDTGKFVRSFADDVRNLCKSFGIVDQGRLLPQTAGSRKRRATAPEIRDALRWIPSCGRFHSP